MSFQTINQLVGSIKSKINDLESILQILLSEYRTASEIIDATKDSREIYVNQLKDLNQTLANIIEGHPALSASKISFDAFNKLTEVAETKQNTIQI